MAAANKGIQIIPMTKDSVCVYCYARPDEMVVPRVLPCGHPACDACIQHQNFTVELECKACKRVFVALYDVSRTLPLIPAEYIAGVMNDEEEANITTPCDLCGDNSMSAVACCTTCRRRLCDDHSVEHRVHVSDHNIIPIIYESTPERYAAQKCVQHERYLLDEICIHCDMPFCSRCVVKSTQCPNYEQHEVVAMKLLADERRVKISDLNEDMYNKMKRCRAVEKEAWRNLSDYEDEVKGYCDDIDKTAETLIHEVRNDADILKREFRNHVQQTSRKVINFSEEILNNLSHLDEMYRKGEELAERSSGNEVITEFTRVTDQLSHDTENMDIEQMFAMQHVSLSKDEATFVLGMRLIPLQSPYAGPEASTDVPTDDDVKDEDVVPDLTSIDAATQTTKPAPTSLRYVRTAKTSDSFYGVSWRADQKLLCALYDGVEVRAADLTLQKEIRTPGFVYSAHSVGGKLITKVEHDNKYSTYIGTEENPAQTLIHEVSYGCGGRVSHMSATSTGVAVIDWDNRQLRVFTTTGDHLYNISLTGMEWPYGVHILPDDAVLVIDFGGGELRKYPLQADAEPVWTLSGLKSPTGVTSDESGYIYVKCNEEKKKIRVISPQGEVITDLYSPQIENVHVCDISVHGDMMVLACNSKGVKLFSLRRD